MRKSSSITFSNEYNLLFCTLCSNQCFFLKLLPRAKSTFKICMYHLKVEKATARCQSRSLGDLSGREKPSHDNVSLGNKYIIDPWSVVLL